MFHTLRSKLLVFIVLIAIIPLIIVGLISYMSQKQEITESAERSLAIQSTSLSVEVSSFLEERLNDTRVLSNNPTLMSEESTSLHIREQIYNFLTVHDIYYDALYIDIDGTVTIQSRNNLVGEDLSDRPWFEDALAENTFVSDIYYSPIVENPALLMAAPIYDNTDKEVKGVLAPIFDLNALYGVLENYTNQQQDTGSGGYAFLLNSEGNVISHPEIEKVFHQNYFEEKGISRGEVDTLVDERGMVNLIDGEVHSFARIDSFPGFDNGWYVGIAADESELYAPLTNLLIRYMVFLGIMLILVTFAVFKLSNYLVRPVQQLVQSTKSFADGERGIRTHVYAYEEINHLNETFDYMTEQLKANEKKDKKSTMVVETTDNGVLAIDRKTKKITLFNKKCEEVFQISKEEAIGFELDELVKSSSAFKSLCDNGNIQELIERNEVKCQFEADCYPANTTEKQTFFLNVSSLPSLDKEEVHDEMLIIMNDLTEKRKMERELLRSEKLKVAGEMAAGFAHEIRNPLTTIKGFIQWFDEQDNSRNKKYYQLIKDEIDRVNHIMNELLSIANPTIVENQENIDVETILKNSLTLHQSEMEKNHVHLEVFFQGGLPLLYTDSNKLKQVFMNLIKNAIEAMPDGGNLNIRTTMENKPNLPRQLVIFVEDSGHGMSDETVQKLGTPFFTTKSSGTGLGLATSYRIVEEMGGTVIVSSQEQKGTTFTIYLPV